MSAPVIRNATAAEFETAVEWAAAEGWNPGLDDTPAFHAVDPDGFFMGFVDDRPVSSISVVRYGGAFGFLGFYIVHPDYRGTGAGLAIWRAGMAYLDGCTVGLDGVVAQQDNYRRSGFELAGRNIRHTGVPAIPAGGGEDADIAPVTFADLAEVSAYDRRHFPADRSAFVRDWTLPTDTPTTRRTRIARRNGAVAGYGTIRACRSGCKIGPLFADDTDVAAALFAALVLDMPAGSEVSFDTPEGNPAAVALARDAGLAPAFETARMYRGTDPMLPQERIFGVTTFELG